MHLLTTLLAATTLTSLTYALGINCLGSIKCALQHPLLKGGHPLDDVVASIDSIDPNRFFQNGEHIACVNSLCAFLQNSGGAPGHSIIDLAHALQGHGCGNCGSVPLFFFQGDNDGGIGELTINAVAEDTEWGCGSGKLGGGCGRG